MSIYTQNKDEIIVLPKGLAGTSTKPGIFLYRSGSIRDHTTAVSASVPSIIAVTCSANTNSVLTRLTNQNAYAIISIASGSSKRQKDTRLVLRYVSASYNIAKSGSRSITGSSVLSKKIGTKQNLIFITNIVYIEI